VTGVEKRGVKIPMEIQKQAVDLDEKMLGVAAPAVGPWQRQLNELGGVKPLAFGQYGELGPGFEQLLLDQLAEEGADEAVKRYLTPNRVVAKGVQLRVLRQRVVMTAQKAQADVLLHRLHYALYRGGTPWRRGATRKTSSTAQPRQGRAWADGDFDADHGFAFDGVGRPAHSKSRARGPIRAEAAAVRAPLLCISPLHQKKKPHTKKLDVGGESIARLVSGPVPLPPSLRRHEGRESMASWLVVEVSFALPAGCMVAFLVYFLK
jgi:hypothetical protein